MIAETTRVECGRCGRVTEWRRMRNGVRQKCTECGDQFPCKGTYCGHADCDEQRQPTLPGNGESRQWEQNQ